MAREGLGGLSKLCSLISLPRRSITGAIMPPRSLKLTADIVSAFVSSNHVPIDQLGRVIADVHRSLSLLDRSAPEQPQLDEATQTQKPAVSIRASVTDSYLVSLDV